MDCSNNLVRLELALLADQGDVGEVFILPQTAKSLTDDLSVLVPVQPKSLHFNSEVTI